GRAGRQGDPGRSQFFVSLEDPLMVKYGALNEHWQDDPASIQRLVEGEHLDQRLFLHSYDIPVEGQRNLLHTRRQAVLDGSEPSRSELARLVTLRVIDDLWADHLARISEYRGVAQWQQYQATPPYFLSLDHRDPHAQFLQKIHAWYQELQETLP